ncbi:MAG: hypothetical protein KFF46_01550 [Desulfobacterales bacterium]|nr:hypothetical protein [Desulfobacterales bacterium]
MRITLSTGRQIDTQKDLSAEERHIVQKLYAWADVVDTVEAFENKRKQALQAGWNGSGQVIERSVLRQIIDDLGKKVRTRLRHQPGSG